MSDLDYTLAVLTHPPGDTLDATIESFRKHVSPAPTKEITWKDVHGSGFCRSTAALWRWASMKSAIPYVFWLEHDFLFDRDVDLSDLADVLFRDRTLAQMALMRDAVNPAERAAGGLFELRRDAYWPEPEGWLSHRSYFTTNPSLMRTDWMRSNPWPDDGRGECEGRFGIELVRRGFRFGVWGDGSPWVRHVGRRTGTGY